ncbi:MAG: NADH-quinone oxidoreductase subunit I [Candidatus Aenigmarchaeota archaeon]|nr:NADH-quinone oxidoreductase subunit I [Candidatus Aenigmarchaeota archaeon]
MGMRIVWEVIRNLFRRPITVMFPEESIRISENYRGEQVFERNKCIGCGLCAKVCPNRAIEMVGVMEGSKKKRYPQIDMGKCCFCGLCQDVCPSGAIELTRKLPVSTPDPSSLIKMPCNMKAET